MTQISMINTDFQKVAGDSHITQKGRSLSEVAFLIGENLCDLRTTIVLRVIP